MVWLTPAVIATLLGSLVLAAVYAFLYFQERQRFLLIWWVGWLIYSLRYVFLLSEGALADPTPFTILKYSCALLSGVFLLWGATEFTERRLPRWAWWAAGAGVLWITATAVRSAPVIWISLPTFTFLAAAYIWTGVLIATSPRTAGLSGAITGGAFIVWGLHKADYPFLVSVPWFAPWGFMLAAVLELVAAIGMLIVYFEITRRQLARSESRYRALFDSAGVGIGYYSRDGEMISVNQVAARRLDGDPASFTGRSMGDLFGEEAGARYTERIRRAIRRMTTESYEDQVDLPSGKRWYMSRYTPLYDVAGDAPGVQIISEDITERKLAEQERTRLLEQIHEQARQMEQILASVPTGVLLLDGDGRVLQANPVAVRDLGVLADAGVGDAISTLGDRNLAELLDPQTSRGLWQEIRVETEVRIFEAIARPVEPSGDTEHWVLVLNDVTRERKVEEELQQQERLASVGQLAAGIAHDFNNIMASVVLYAQMVGQSPELSRRDRDRVAVISQQAHHATSLIQQILDFSRRSVLERRPLDLAQLIREQAQLLSRTLPEHITIELDVGPDNHVVSADPTRLRQVLTNLAVNARDAMPDGGRLGLSLARVTLHAADTQGAPAEAWVRLTISDTGSGIPGDVLPHIYEPFYTTKGPGEGNGLGLSQVHGIVGQHGGRIDVETELGQGTRFVIDLPALSVDVREPESLPEMPAPTGNGETILVVEDNRVLGEALVELLQNMAYRVLYAANGSEALAVLDAHPEVDLVLSDLVMPEMGGRALFHELQARDAHLPVVIMTGHPMQQEVESLVAGGLSAWFVKPPDPVELALTLSRLLHAAA